MENIKGFDAKEYLKSKIATLDECSFLSGTEGNVYFVDDSFVVKTYFEPFDDMRIFNEYCKEIKSFGDKGYAVPRIHAWATIPCLGGERFIAYILEDRALTADFICSTRLRRISALRLRIPRLVLSKSTPMASSSPVSAL